jgi:hypothetical protein
MYKLQRRLSPSDGRQKTIVHRTRLAGSGTHVAHRLQATKNGCFAAGQATKSDDLPHGLAVRAGLLVYLPGKLYSIVKSSEGEPSPTRLENRGLLRSRGQTTKSDGLPYGIFEAKSFGKNEANSV